MCALDLKTTLRTGESLPVHAARMFIVPMTLFSCARRDEVTIESTTSRVSTIVSISAASTMRRMSECASETCTNSVRSSSTLGGRRSMPMIASTLGSRSRACASRPPQYVDRPVTRMRLEWLFSANPDRPPLGEHLEQLLLDPRADLVGDGLDESLVLPWRVAEVVGAQRLEEADLELRRQVARHPEGSAVRERRRQRHVEQAGDALQELEVGEDRRGLLGADDGDRHDRRPRAHRGLHEAAAPEAPQPVAVLVELLGALAALGEDEHQLALVVEQAVHVGRVGGHAADLWRQHREAGIALEEVLHRQIERARARVLLLDRLGDHRRVGRQRSRVVGDEQRAAVGGHVVDALDLDAEPVAVQELDGGAVDEALDALRAPPVVDAALGLDAG